LYTRCCLKHPHSGRSAQRATKHLTARMCDLTTGAFHPRSRETLDAIFDHHIIHLMRLLQRPISRRLCDVSYVYIYNPLHGRIPLSRFSFAIRCCLLSLDRPAAFLVQRWCWGIIVLYRSRCRVRLRKTGDIQAHCRRGPLLTKQKYIITS